MGDRRSAKQESESRVRRRGYSALDRGGALQEIPADLSGLCEWQQQEQGCCVGLRTIHDEPRQRLEDDLDRRMALRKTGYGLDAVAAENTAIRRVPRTPEEHGIFSGADTSGLGRDRDQEGR